MADIAFGHYTNKAFGTSPITWTHDSTGDSFLCVVVRGAGGDVNTISAVTYNGVALTLMAVQSATAHVTANRFAIYYLNRALGTDAGSHTVSVTWSGGSNLGAA